MNNILVSQILRTFFVIFLVTCILLFIKVALIYIYPFIIATCIAFILHPVVSFIEVRWKVTRGIATFIVMGSSFIIFIFTIYFILRQLVRETTLLIEMLPAYFQNISIVLFDLGQTIITPLYDRISTTFPFLPILDDAQFTKYVHHIIDFLNVSSTTFIKNIFTATSSIFSSLTYISIVCIFIGLSSFFMTKDSVTFQQLYVKLIPSKVTHQLTNVVTHLKRSILGLLRAQIILTALSSIIIFTGLLFFRVANVFSITLTVFIIDFIPYAGIGVIFIPWIIYSFYTAKYVLTIQLAILYIVIIIIQQLIEPKIVAANIGIHPIVAIFILFIGIQRFGLLGIIMTPVVLIVTSAIYRAGIIHYVWRYVRSG